jgi:hypothetical protein
VAATAAADMVAVMAGTVADRPPAMAAVPAAPAAGVDVADVAAAIRQLGPMCPPDRMQNCAAYTSISH